MTERSNLIEVHLEIMRHLLGEFILWCATSGELQEHCLRRLCLGICSAVLGCKVWVVAAVLGHCDWFEAEGVVLHANLYDRAVHALLQVAASEGELAGLPGSELQGLSELSNGLLPLLP